MNNTFVIVLVVIVTVLLLRPKSVPQTQDKAPANAQPQPQPQGAQNLAPADTFADVVNAMSKAIDSIANVADTFTQRN